MDWSLEEENRKLARSVQELQHRLDETTEGTKPVFTDFTTTTENVKTLGAIFDFIKSKCLHVVYYKKYLAH